MERMPRLFGKRDMNCQDVRKLSSEYLDEDLPPSRLERFRAHLSGCAPCQAFVDGLASMVRMLTTLPKTESPPTLRQSIIERIAEEEGKGSKRG